MFTWRAACVPYEHVLCTAPRNDTAPQKMLESSPRSQRLLSVQQIRAVVAARQVLIADYSRAGTLNNSRNKKKNE